MAVTTIQWTWRRLPDGTWVRGYTFNPWIGCVKIAPECKHCYAEGFAARWGWKVWGPAATTPRRLTSAANWKKPLQWNREAEAQGHRRSVFCASLADVFEDHPDIVEARARLWALIGQTPWLNWLLLTKRPENMVTMAPWGAAWPDNVWAGTSAGTQASADRNVPYLLSVPAVVHFVSCEPQLAFVNFRPYLKRLQWVICGGESGAKARPFDLAWARDLRDQCVAAGVPYFFKQVGGRYHDSGGRMLDGRTWDEMPPEVPEGSQAEDRAKETFTERNTVQKEREIE
jgi:protein gp37